MSKVVRENCPVSDLPKNLRKGLPADDSVDVTIQLAAPEPDRISTLKELLAIRRPPYRSTEEIVEELRRERDAWTAELGQ